MSTHSVLIVSPSAGFTQHARLALGPACKVEVMSGMDESPGDASGTFDLAIVHRGALENGDEHAAFEAIRQRAGAIAVAADVPSLEELLELSRHRIQAYCNSYMTDVHYRQLAAMLADGMTWFHPPILLQALAVARDRRDGRQRERSSALEMLTKREQEIAGDVAAGLSNREIAEQRCIKERTVKAHLTRIFKKLGTRNRHALAVRLRSP